MSAAMYAQMGNKAVGVVSDHLLQNTQRKMQLDAQEHRNTMSAISAAMQSNNITREEINTQDSARRLKQQIDLASMQDKGNAEVSAAAAGVAGGSVDNTMRGLTRSAMQANYARIRKMTFKSIQMEPKVVPGRSWRSLPKIQESTFPEMTSTKKPESTKSRLGCLFFTSKNQ